MSATMERWEELAREEIGAARAGYGCWRAFVSKCERELGQPWSVIRHQFDGMHRAGVTNHPLYRGEPRP